MSEADGDLAVRLATEAGDLLLAIRARAAAERWETKQTKDTGDRESHEFLMAALAAARPGDAVLSEEGKDDPVRLTARRVWIVDPLDGTREFSELERDDWAVHVALLVDGVLAAGAVALPSLGTSLGAHTVPKAIAHDRRPRILVSRTRPPQEAERIAEALQGELVGMGSAGAKAAAVIRGDADLYVHSGGQYEWDLAAPVAVAIGAGLHATRLDGAPFVFNRADPYLPDALIGDPSLAARALESLR